MVSEKTRQLANLIKDSIRKSGVNYSDLSDLLDVAIHAIDNEDGVKWALKVTGYVKECCNYAIKSEIEVRRMDEFYWKSMKIESHHWLDSYCLYIEQDRPARERFYQPRRKTLIKVVDKLQMLEDDLLDELFIHLPARTGKSQIMTMGTSWHTCRNTELSNLYCSYKEDAGGAFLDGYKEILTDPIYRHSDIFPLAKIVDTDAKANTIDLERKKKYKSLSGKGLTSGLNGLYDANGWLIADDVLEGIQDVLSPDILRRKQIIFDNNLMKRKKEKCKVIYNGTIWSLHDIYMNRLAFLQNNPEARGIRHDVIKIPALDPETDESNFDYDYGVGYSTKYYRAVRAKAEEDDDMASWFAQCQQEPIERDGAVFNPEHMNFYNGELPAETPLRVCAVCDVSLGGTDYLSFPVAYVYEDGSVYVHDVVFDTGEKQVTQPFVIEKILKNDVKSVCFEANNGGEGYKDDIDRKLREKGIRLNITSKYAPGKRGKEQRIWDAAGRIREFYFRDDGCRNAEYRKFMNNLYSFTMVGKNKHEDAPDSLAQLVDFIDRGTVSIAKVIKSPI